MSIVALVLFAGCEVAMLASVAATKDRTRRRCVAVSASCLLGMVLVLGLNVSLADG